MAGDFVDCCHMKNKNHPDCCPVVTKPNDPFYSKNNRPNCQSVIRSRQIKKPNSMTHKRCEIGVENSNSAWIDASFLYGSTKKRADFLRTFKEFVPKILGKGSKLHLPYRQGYKNYYKPRVDGSVSIEFATAGFRLHSLISSWYDLVDSNYRVKSKLHLRDIFRSPLGLLNGTVYDDIMRGMAQQPLKEFNNIYTPEMTEWMLRKGSNDFGFDIAAITIQRGRDHQLKGYTAY
ncbi:Putative LOC100119851, partial [Caligus rogercresseyi]